MHIRTRILLVLGSLAMAAAGRAEARMPGDGRTAGGQRQRSAVYVTMPDGVEIAVDVWLPLSYRPGDRCPVLLRTTRYWRAVHFGWGLRLLAALRLYDAEALTDVQRAYFNSRGFVVLKADARGSGASGGRRRVEYSPEEVADLGELAAWAAHQPWSNGRVGTFGVSYDGNTAEMAAVSQPPALRAVMPLYDDFDVQALVQPGGVLLRGFVDRWSTLVTALDRDDLCAAEQSTGLRCWRDHLVATGVAAVDADPGRLHLRQLVGQHHTLDIANSVGKAEFRDDALRSEGAVFHYADISPYGQRRRISASAVPMMVWCGWLDAETCEGALIRYRTLANPQLLVIGPLSHGGGFNADPFASAHLPPVPPPAEQYRMEADFFESLLQRNPPDAIVSSIRYYTMGEGSWHSSSTWPPAGAHTTRLYLEASGRLSDAPPTAGASGARAESAESETSDTYAVDFTATSGNATRWHTQLGGGDVVYPDRAAADRRLLTYTGPPLAADVEITGSPVLTLEMASSAPDGAIHAYLEDVAPDGRVTYLDEGVFRLLHRKEVDPGSLPFTPLGPAHSFLRQDAQPLRPGEPASVRFALYPTSILLRRGHCIRLALAGADAPLFARYPPTGAVTWTVYRGAARPSVLELPTLPR